MGDKYIAIHKYTNPCEYNPEEKRAAYYNEVHAEAEVIVGSNGKWILCEKCSELKEFNRFKIRTKIKKRKNK